MHRGDNNRRPAENSFLMPCQLKAANPDTWTCGLNRLIEKAFLPI